jgi:hypothetical protein
VDVIEDFLPARVGLRKSVHVIDELAGHRRRSWVGKSERAM